MTNTLYPWHLATYQQIIHAFEQGRGHHALLFKTDLGLGTETLIDTFAHWLFCLNPHHTQPCQQCKSCLLWQSGNHPDFHRIESIDGKDIGVDQIRELTAKLHQFSQQGGRIVVNIAQAERLTESAANALLKTLEEPHDNIYFLLQTPLQSSMLATIQSRCQTWLIHPPEPADAFLWLQQQCPTETAENLEIALRICHRRPLICQTFLENDQLTHRKRFLQTFWRCYKNGDAWLLLSAFDKEYDGAQAQLEWLASFFSDAIKAKIGIATDWINPDLQAGILPFSQALCAHTLLKSHQLIQQTQHDLTEINAVNQELILADCVTKLLTLIRPS
ncbi:MAG: DNA polymerase III subunit delta' [Pasteurellaceae bacterium]|nr:DNA polymerase III subunit delta' [Pasteurellaceae bacterium]